MAEEVGGAFAVLLERVEGDGEARFGGDGFELEIDGEGHALHLEVEEGGFGGGAAAFAPEEAGHVEDELFFEGAFGAMAAEEVVVEGLEFVGVFGNRPVGSISSMRWSWPPFVPLVEYLAAATTESRPSRQPSTMHRS